LTCSSAYKSKLLLQMLFMKSCLHVCMHVCVCLCWRKVDKSLVGSEAVRPCCVVNECLVLSLSHYSLQSPPQRAPAAPAAAAAEKSLPVTVRQILLLVVIMYVVCATGAIIRSLADTLGLVHVMCPHVFVLQVGAARPPPPPTAAATPPVRGIESISPVCACNVTEMAHMISTFQTLYGS
jgi:hypothetical protein